MVDNQYVAILYIVHTVYFSTQFNTVVWSVELIFTEASGVFYLFIF